jgi:hypothetical protein
MFRRLKPDLREAVSSKQHEIDKSKSAAYWKMGDELRIEEMSGIR